MNLIEYLYPLVCNDLNFILFLIVTMVINDFRFYQLLNVFLLQVINTLIMTFGM